MSSRASHSIPSHILLEYQSIEDEAGILERSVELLSLKVHAAAACTLNEKTGAVVTGPFALRGASEDLPHDSGNSNIREVSGGGVPFLKLEPPLYLNCYHPVIMREAETVYLLVLTLKPGNISDELKEYAESVAFLARTSILTLESRTISAFHRGDPAVLLDGLDDGLLLLDDGLSLKYHNAAFLKLISTEAAEQVPAELGDVAGGVLFRELSDDLAALLTGDSRADRVMELEGRTLRVILRRIPGSIMLSFRDITDAERTRKELRFREKLEGILINIATDFIEMKGSALNMGINDALLNIGVTIGVDRAHLFQFSPDLRYMSNTHEWCASNIQPGTDALQNIETGLYPWWMNRLRLHETICIRNLSQLPPWAEAEMKLLQDQDVQSMVVVPIIHGNRLLGCIGFDSVNQERQWDEDIVDLLRVVGDAIGNALERNRMEKELLEQYHRAEKEARENAVLLREVNHRVKNNLSEIIGLLYAQKRFADPGEYRDEFIESLIARVRGLATVHNMLSRSGWSSIALRELASEIVRSALEGASDSKEIRISISNSTATVKPDQAHALALVLNELARNSLKHALNSCEELTVKVRMRRYGNGRIILTYSDNGPGYPEEVMELKRMNLGLDLIRNIVNKTLQGELTLRNDGGAVTAISFLQKIRKEGSHGR